MKSIAELADTLQSLQDRLSHGPVDCRGDVGIEEFRAREYGQVLDEYRQNVVAMRDRNAHLRNEVKYLSGRVLKKQKRIGELEVQLRNMTERTHAAESEARAEKELRRHQDNIAAEARRIEREARANARNDVGELSYPLRRFTQHTTHYIKPGDKVVVVDR